MWRIVGPVLEVAVLSGIILVTRCANYSDVFVGGRVYFVDADCYARMTRVRMVVAEPGLVVRHHAFENFPAGTDPHTTAPLDYLIAGLTVALSSVTAQPLELAGAMISPLLALAAGWFLWWWTRRFAWPGRYGALLVYALSAILVHSTAVGRPDQQALLVPLLLIALGAEWRLQEGPSRPWSIVSGASWAVALWVSLYEPLVLFLATMLGVLISSRGRLIERERRIGWTIFFAILVLAAVVERRWPEPPPVQPFFANWSATIGELRPVGLTNPIWLSWVSGLVLVSPLLLALGLRRGVISPLFAGLLGLSFLLTLWEARWGYFFALIFVLTIPAQIGIVRQKWLALGLLGFALWPLLKFWDAQFWPDEESIVRRMIARREMAEWRAAVDSLGGKAPGAVLSPWWLAPATAYWSQRPVVGGSAHESLPGTVATARFFLTTSPGEARAILERHRVHWVLAGAGRRVAQNSAALLRRAAPPKALCWILDREPSRAPAFLALRAQNGACKVYEFRDSK